MTEALVGQKPRRLYYFAEGLDSGDSGDQTRAIDDARTPVDNPLLANLVGSLCTDGMHRPVLDLDFPCELVPSSTPGHFHLYIDVAMAQSAYLGLVKALADVGIVQRFYAEAAQIRGQTFVRPPWVKKPAKAKQLEPSTVVDTEGESPTFEQARESRHT